MIHVVGLTIDASDVPADRLANGCKKVLGLLGDGGKVFEDDVAVVGTYPKGS